MVQRTVLVALLALAACVVHERGRVVAEPPPVAVGLTFETFDQGLAPYGAWFVVQPYGRVWRPFGVPAGWMPYYFGTWDWTADGWFFVSDEPWSWAAYHYGRWAYDPYHGWFWVPGYEWAPAWVAWRVAPDAVGWAPIPPGMTLAVDYGIPPQWFVFVPASEFVGVRIPAVAYPRPTVEVLYHQARPAPPVGAPGGAPAPRYGGPPPALVERHIGRRLAPRPVAPAPSPSAARGVSPSGAIPVYRPAPAPAPAPPSQRAPAAPAPAPAQAAPPPRPAPPVETAPAPPPASAANARAVPDSTAARPSAAQPPMPNGPAVQVVPPARAAAPPAPAKQGDKRKKKKDKEKEHEAAPAAPAPSR